MRFAVSAYEQDRSAVAAALRPLFAADPAEEHGFLVFRGSADPAAVEEVARAAGALSIYPEEEGEEDAGAHRSAEPAEASAAEVEAEVPTAEAEAPAAEAPAPGTPFCARFPTPDDGIAFARAAAGTVTFSDPPTGWEDGSFCVRGSGDAAAVAALAAACGGSTQAPQATVEATAASAEAPPSAKHQESPKGKKK